MGNLDLLRAAYDAFERGDRDAALVACAPDIEWHQAQGLPHGGLYRGLDAVRANVFAPLHASWWETFSAPPDEFVDAGDTVVVLGRYRGVAKGTGRVLDVPYVHVWTFVDDRATVFRQFLDTAGWNAALAP